MAAQINNATSVALPYHINAFMVEVPPSSMALYGLSLSVPSCITNSCSETHKKSVVTTTSLTCLCSWLLLCPNWYSQWFLIGPKHGLLFLWSHRILWFCSIMQSMLHCTAFQHFKSFLSHQGTENSWLTKCIYCRLWNIRASKALLHVYKSSNYPLMELHPHTVVPRLHS